MAPSNPCTNPNLPPIRIEFSDNPCDKPHPQYLNGVTVVKAYWQQATNMTLEDQIEYKPLIEQQLFEKKWPWVLSSSDHRICKLCQASPTWAKYVFIRALRMNTEALDSQVQGIFGSLNISDLERFYRAYHPEPARELKRKAVDQLQQRSDGSSQQNTSPALGQKLPFNADLQRLENHLKKYMDRRFDKIQNSFFEARTDERNKIRAATEQIALVLEKMIQLKREQTEYFNAMEKRIDRMGARRPERGEI